MGVSSCLMDDQIGFYKNNNICNRKNIFLGYVVKEKIKIHNKQNL